MLPFPRVMMVTMLLALALALFSPQVAVEAKRERLAPTECTVEPRSAGDAVAAADATPVPVGSPIVDTFVEVAGELPQGEPVSPDVADQITAFMQEYAGCVNGRDGARMAVMMTEASAAYLGGEAGITAAFASESGEAPPEIAWVSIRDPRQLADGRVGAIVEMGIWLDERKKPVREAVFFLFERGGAGWLFAGQIIGNVEGGPTLGSDEEILGRARHGFNEVDSALYAEPTMAGAKFSISAQVMVGFLNADEITGVGCEMFVIERGASSATITALCRADASLTGRAAYLEAEVQGPQRSSVRVPVRCEDVAELSEMVAFSCTVDLSEVPVTPP